MPRASLSLILTQSRERILTAILRAIATLGLLSLIVTTPALIRDQQLRLLTFYVAMLVLTWLAALNRRIDYRLRAGLLLLIQYSLGLLDLLNFGLAEEGRIFLFGFSVAAILLLGGWVGLGALALSVATIAGIGWLISTDQFVIFQPANIPTAALTIETLIITCTDFLMQAGMVIAALYVLLGDFNTAWQRERLATSQLQQERDLLEQRVAERTYELAQARDHALAASRLKTELLTKVSHELRTPLGVVLGYAELLQAELYGPISVEQQEPIQYIIASSHYLTKQVNELLDQARLGAGKLELYISTFVLADIVNEVHTQMQILAQAKGLTLTTKMAADMPASLSGDPVRLQQILINLVGNAVKFTKTGSVSLSIYKSYPNYWAIQVSDTGPGIPLEAQTYIFEPFRQVDGSMTREHEGIGLGLSIVKQLVIMMGGQINLDSELGQGSTFTVLLPLELTQEASA